MEILKKSYSFYILIINLDIEFSTSIVSKSDSSGL